MSRSATALGLLVVLVAAQADAAAGRRPMTVEDLWSMQRVGAPALSPDGRWVAVAITSYSMQDNKGNSDLWLVATAGSTPPRRLTWNESADSQPAWSPDGTRLAYVSKRGDDQAQLFVLHLAGGEPEPVTKLPVAVADPRWFPDGRRLAFLASTWPDLNDDFTAVKQRLDARKDDKVKANIGDTRLLRFWDHWLTGGEVPHLFEVDLESRRVRDLLPGSKCHMDFSGAEGTWDLAPDGSEIVFAANSTEPPYRSLNFDVYTVAVAGGEPRNRTADNPADDTSPCYTPDGGSILFGRYRRVEVDAEFARLARLDRGSDAVRVLTDDFDAHPSGWTCAPDGRTVFFHAAEGGRTHLYRMPVAGGAPQRVLEGGSTHHVAAGPRGLLVCTRETLLEPGEVWAVGADGKHARALTAFNRDLLAQLDLGSVRDVTFAGAGGDPVQMFVVLPPGFTPTRRWPLVQVLHGGPHGIWGDQFHYRWNATLFASRGCVTALVNFHGSTASGQEFAESIVGAHGDKPFTDIMKSTDWLIAQGWVDSTRMAAAGGSYGGYLVSWILGHTDRFAALVDHAGVYDLMAQFASDATWGRARNYGAEPWVDPERIDRWSPNRHAAHFVTPTLLLHGEKDYRVPVTQGLELYGVLQAKGVPARIVVFPDENHWVLKPQSARLWWGEVFAWLDRWLGTGSGEAAGDAGVPAAAGR